MLVTVGNLTLHIVADYDCSSTHVWPTLVIVSTLKSQLFTA